MCRALLYLGKPILIDDLLFKTDNSLIKQTYNPKHMAVFNNLAGFGIAFWNKDNINPQYPYLYKSKNLPFYDKNLKYLAVKMAAECMLAHIRGTVYTEKIQVIEENVHPFIFDGYQITLAHNGSLTNFDVIKYSLLDYIEPSIAAMIHGSTDSEWVYAVFISQLRAHTNNNNIKDIVSAVIETINILAIIRKKFNITTASALNLFITNGKFLVATRFVFDFGSFINHFDVDDLKYQSLWYTYGEEYVYADYEFKMRMGLKPQSIIIASEPMTEDTTSWFEVPEYSIIAAHTVNNQLGIEFFPINR